MKEYKAMIVPYGYYSLKDVFNKFGLLIFGDGWDNSIVNFREDTSRAYANQDFKSERGAIIPPITEDYLIEKVESFNVKQYSDNEIEVMRNVFFLAHCNHEEITFTMLSKKLNYEKASDIESLLKDHKDAGLIKAKLQMIEKGIKYANISSGLKQIFYSEQITGEIIDIQNGTKTNIGKEYWLAINSIYNFGQSFGLYEDCYISGGRFLNPRNPALVPTYQGLIIFEQDLVDDFINDWKKKNKSGASNAGRKSKIKWSEFNSEAMKRLSSDDINNLTKQDALAEDMKNWCKESFNEIVGLSTIKGKLKPLYDLLKEEA